MNYRREFRNNCKISDWIAAETRRECESRLEISDVRLKIADVIPKCIWKNQIRLGAIRIEFGRDTQRAWEVKKIKITKKYLQELIKEEVQDYIGGMVRPDQLKSFILDDLKQCIHFVENEQWEFQSLLRNISKRVEILAELVEDDDDEV